MRILLLLLMLAIPFVGMGETIRLQWEASTSLEVTGYYLRYGTNRKALTEIVSTTTTNFNLTNATAGQDYYFDVIAHDSFDNRSDPTPTLGVLNMTVAPGYSLVSCSWTRNTNDNVGSKFGTNLPNGFALYKYQNGRYAVNFFDLGEWLDPNQSFKVGEGAWIFNPTQTNFTLQVWGNITNSFETRIKGGDFNLIGSAIPDAGFLETDYFFHPTNYDMVYFWRNNRWEIYQYDFFIGGWEAEPKLKQFEGFFVYSYFDSFWIYWTE